MKPPHRGIRNSDIVNYLKAMRTCSIEQQEPESVQENKCDDRCDCPQLPRIAPQILLSLSLHHLRFLRTEMSRFRSAAKNGKHKLLHQVEMWNVRSLCLANRSSIRHRKRFMKTDIEPLEPTTWFIQIEKLLNSTLKLDGQGPDAVLRHAVHLTQLTPRPLQSIIRLQVEEETIEDMLDCSAYASAIMMILSPPIEYKLEQTGSGKYLASVSCPNSPCSGQGEAPTIEEALLYGWCRCILDMRRRAGQSNHRVPHRSRYEQHRRSTEH